MLLQKGLVKVIVSDDKKKAVAVEVNAETDSLQRTKNSRLTLHRLQSRLWKQKQQISMLS